jgi:non-ribosomal peptide synthetase component F
VADKGYVHQLLAAIPDPTTKRVLLQAFDHVLDNLRLGVPANQERAVNLQAYWLVSTTANSTGGFTIAHGLPAAPHYAIPVLDLSQPGAQLVPLEVDKAADGRRMYLKSTSTNASIALLVE